MSPAAATDPSAQIARALVDFSVEGAFPEENVSLLAVTAEDLAPAINALATAKSRLEVPSPFREVSTRCAESSRAKHVYRLRSIL